MKHHSLFFILLLSASATNAQQWIEHAEFNRQILMNDKNLFGYAQYIWKQDIKKARVLIPYQYQSAERFDKAGNAVVEANGKFGLVDTLGNQVIPVAYDYVYSFSNGFATVYNNGKFGAVNHKGAVVIPIEYDYIAPFKKCGRTDAVKGNKWGVINSSNTTILPFQYILARTDDNGFTRAIASNWEYFDPSGKLILDESYQAIAHEGNGYAVGITTTHKKVLFNAKWEKVLPAEFTYYSLYKSGNPCIVSSGGKYGLYDLEAKKLLLPLAFSSMQFDNDVLTVTTEAPNKVSYFTDLKGNKLFGKEFQQILAFVDYTGFAEVMQNNKWGLIDRKGNWILRCEMGNEQESTIHIDMTEGRISARKTSGWGMTDLKGNMILPFQFVEPLGRLKVNPFYFNNEEKIEVVKDINTGKEGIVNNKGNWLFAPGNSTYDDFGLVTSFISNGGIYVPVAKDKKWGVYDFNTRKEIIPLKLNDLNSLPASAHIDFLDREKEKWGLVVYSTGKIYSPGEFDYKDYDEESNLVIVEKNGLKGLQDATGKTVTPVIYQALSYDSESGYYYAGKNGKGGFIDQKGNIVIPIMYDPEPMWMANSFVNGHVRMDLNEKSLLLDLKGKTILTSADFKGPDEMFIIKTRFWGNTWCYMGKNKNNGEEVIKIIVNGKLYENLGGDIYNTRPATSVEFTEGLLAAKRDGLYGFLDRKGNEIIPFEYERAGSLDNGTAYVQKAGKYFKINRNGTRLRYADHRLAILATQKK